MPKITAPTITATLDLTPPLVFTTQAAILNATIQSGEGDRSNSCNLVLSDPGLKIGARLRDLALKKGGIVVPGNLLEDPAAAAAAGGTPSSAPGSSKQLPKDGNPGSDPNSYIGGTTELSLTAEERAYLDLIAWCEGAAYNSIFSYAEVVTDFSRHPEKVLGGSGLRSDAAGRGQFLSTTWKPLGLPDFSPASQDLGVKKLIQNRGVLAAVNQGLAGLDRFMDACSYEWASIPSAAGEFRYDGQGSKTPAMLREFLGRALNYYKSGGAVAPSQAVQVGPINPAKVVGAEAIAAEAIEIAIEVAWAGAKVRFQLWYTGHSFSSAGAGTTTIQGRGVRYFISSSDRSRGSYKNISLRQIAQRLGDKAGVKIDVPSTPATEKIAQTLNQSGLTDYQFLRQLAEDQGFLVQEVAGAKGQPGSVSLIAASDKGAAVVEIKKQWGPTLQSTEIASAERILKALPSINTIEDGKSIGEGFTTTLNLSYPGPEVLSWKPGSIVDLKAGSIHGIAPTSAIYRQYRLKSVTINYQGGILSVSLGLYIPVSIKPKAIAAGSSNSPLGSQSGAVGKATPPKKDGKFFFLSTTGTKTQYGEQLLELAYWNNGTKQGSWQAVSGSGRNQNLADSTTQGSYAPCPQNLTGYQLANGDYDPSGTAFPWGIGKWWIEVLNTPGRAAIGIHQDANRNEGSPGTAGCIGLLDAASMEAVYTLYQGGCNWLIIDYTGWVN